MKILFIADNFPPEINAQASRVYERACYWQRWGHTVSVMTCFPNFPEGKLHPGYKEKIRDVSYIDGIRVVRVKTFIAANAGVLLRIVDFVSFMVSAGAIGILEEKPDVVVATSPQLFAAIAGWFLSVIHRVPFVMELSDLWPESISAVGAMKSNMLLKFVEKIELFLYARAQRVVSLTDSFKRNLMRRGVPEAKIDVVVNGVDLSRYSPKERDSSFASTLGIAPTDFVIGYVGTLGMAHGLQNVLDAAGALNDSKIKFLLIGPGAEREELIRKAQELRLTNVIIAPAQPKEKMPSVWSICDVALVHLKNTALFETVIPSKIFEAMAMGLPILIASPAGEATAIIEREGCGVVIPPENPIALARAASAVFSDRAQLQRFAAQSRLAASRYSRERQAKLMIDSLKSATGEISRGDFNVAAAG